MAFPAVTSSAEADCVVTAMFLGLAREMVGGKKTFTVVAKAKEQLTASMTRANKALKTMDIKNMPDVKTASAVDWKQGSYITGKQHGKGLPGSLMAEAINYDDLAYNDVKESKNLPAGALYLGPGAYTGMLLVDKVAKYVGSTFQTKVNRPGVSGTMIGGGLPGMEKEGGAPAGYVHGMIQAIYASAASGFKGITIEVAAGEKTKKLASCFGCTIFMFANDRPPDGIHLGEAASWTTADPASKWQLERMNERFLDRVDVLPDRTAKLAEAIAYQNKKWAAKCAVWLHYGATIDKACVDEKHKKAWDALRAFTEKENPASGTLFLNALGFEHGDDFKRIERTLNE